MVEGTGIPAKCPIVGWAGKLFAAAAAEAAEAGLKRNMLAEAAAAAAAAGGGWDVAGVVSEYEGT